MFVCMSAYDKTRFCFIYDKLNPVTPKCPNLFPYIPISFHGKFPTSNTSRILQTYPFGYWMNHLSIKPAGSCDSDAIAAFLTTSCLFFILWDSIYIYISVWQKFVNQPIILPKPFNRNTKGHFEPFWFWIRALRSYSDQNHESDIRSVSCIFVVSIKTKPFVY